MIRKRLASALCIVLLCVASVRHAVAEPSAKLVTGPALVCLTYSTFSLLSGERVTGSSANLDVVSIEVEGASGPFSIVETAIMKPPPERGRLVLRRSNVSIYWVRGANEHYDVYGHLPFYQGRERLLLQLHGPSLTGTAGDAMIYRRLDVRDPKSVNCRQTFKTMSF